MALLKRRLALMKKKFLFGFFSVFCFGLVIFAEEPVNRDILYQFSSINAILDGIYDGELAVSELLRHGDFGIGTLDGLEGEVIISGGEVFNIRVDGKSYPVEDSATTPFAVTTFFEADKTVMAENIESFEELQKLIDSVLPSDNIFYAVKITGKFTFIRTRSVPKQTKPYPPLVEVTRKQKTFDFNDVPGVIAGFRVPEYAKGVSMAGYHLHFLTDDKKSGGHLLQVKGKNLKIELDYTSDFHMQLPGNSEFFKMDMIKDREKELHEAER